ncbi:MAG TPA: tyrosine-type recombinase/integrase [Trebonia sp.]|jgi:site-specific recombinase XerD|nr:tyrosine-type recombinase/integrase [Trebonia sp.]
MASEEWEGRASDELAWNAYRRFLAAEGKSGDTIGGYRRALQLLSRHLPDGVTLETMTAVHVAGWLEAGRDGWAHSTLASYSRRARTYCLWAHRAGYADANPMSVLKPVREHLAETVIPDPGDIRKVADLLGRGRDFESRRDWAIVCLLAEAGTPRATELAELTADCLDLRHDQLRFWGKGGLERTIPLGAATCRALTLYLRARAQHRCAGLPWLFLGRKGKMTRHGVRQMLGRRCRQAGVKAIPPHHFRHLTAHTFMDRGGSEADAMKLYGWRTPLMASHYGASAAGARAVRHAREMSIGDAILTGKPS